MIKRTDIKKAAFQYAGNDVHDNYLSFIAGAEWVFSEMNVNNNDRPKEEQKWQCLICGRDKFNRTQPHRCIGGFRKRGLKWKKLDE